MSKEELRMKKQQLDEMLETCGEVADVRIEFFKSHGRFVEAQNAILEKAKSINEIRKRHSNPLV